MGVKSAISEQEYLRTSFPGLDQEYRHGALIERNLPDYLHARTQLRIGGYFLALESTLRTYACSEIRLKIAPGNFRIADVAVFHPMPPEHTVPDSPPFIAVEILSPDDRMSEARAKLEEYKNWGVPHVWLVDPHAKRMYTCDQGLVEVPSLKIPELNLELSSSAIFD